VCLLRNDAIPIACCMSPAERKLDTKQLEVKLGVVVGSRRVTKSRRRKCKHAPEAAAEAIPSRGACRVAPSPRQCSCRQPIDAAVMLSGLIQGIWPNPVFFI
jgi:hypothetical protein